MKREKFIGTICPLLLASMLASPVLVSCSKEEEPTIPLSEEEEAYLNIIALLNEDGYLTEGKKLHIHLNHKRYQNLDQNESFVNDMENGLLLLRKTEDALLAFDNCCPHLGSRNQWTFSNNKFRCNNHGNTFGTSEGFTSYCSSNSRSGNLRQFPVVVFKDLATVDFS